MEIYLSSQKNNEPATKLESALSTQTKKSCTTLHADSPTIKKEERLFEGLTDF